MDNSILEKRKKRWEEALMLAQSNDLFESGVKELTGYFPYGTDEVHKKLVESEQRLAKEWHAMKINKNNSDSVMSFYNNTQLEIFELMDWHIRRFNSDPFPGPLQYVCAMEIAKRLGLKEYLDYGSGVGSGALLFLKNGFNVTCADIADPLLKFIDYRMKIRKMSVSKIDLKKERLPNNKFDIITCFDVLEHTIDPSAVVKQLRQALKSGGLLILNNAECKIEEAKPMHITCVGLEKRLRFLGFKQLWEIQDEFKRGCSRYIIVLKRVQRYFVFNILFYLYDNFLPIWFNKIIKKLRSVQ